jgi:hypothetical protein
VKYQPLGQIDTVVNDHIRRFTCDRITIVYFCVVYGEIWWFTGKKTIVYYRRIRSLFFSVYDRITPYTVTEIYDRITITCNTAKCGRVRRNTERTGSFTSVHGRLRAYMESIFVDLDRKLVIYQIKKNNLREKLEEITDGKSKQWCSLEICIYIFAETVTLIVTNIQNVARSDSE